MMPLMQREERYKGYVLSWQEPPQTGVGFEVNINPKDRAKFRRTHVMPPNRSLEVALAEARKYVDDREGG